MVTQKGAGRCPKTSCSMSGQVVVLSVSSAIECLPLRYYSYQQVWPGVISDRRRKEGRQEAGFGDWVGGALGRGWQQSYFRTGMFVQVGASKTGVRARSSGAQVLGLKLNSPTQLEPPHDECSGFERIQPCAICASE